MHAEYHIKKSPHEQSFKGRLFRVQSYNGTPDGRTDGRTDGFAIPVSHVVFSTLRWQYSDPSTSAITFVPECLPGRGQTSKLGGLQDQRTKLSIKRPVDCLLRVLRDCS